MYCKKCGKELKESDSFCPYCGAEIKKKPESAPEIESDAASEDEAGISTGRRTKRLLLCICAFVLVAVAAGGGLMLYKNMRKKPEEKTAKKEETLTEEKALELYEDFSKQLEEEYGVCEDGDIARELAIQTAFPNGPVKSMHFQKPLEKGEKGVFGKWIEDMNGDGIPEMIVAVVADSGEYVQRENGEDAPENAWIELYAYRIGGDMVIPLEQEEDMVYQVLSESYQGMWCGYIAEKEGEKSLVILSMFQNGVQDLSLDYRTSVFQVRDKEFECVYSTKNAGAELKDLRYVLPEEQGGELWGVARDNWYTGANLLAEELGEYTEEDMKPLLTAGVDVLVAGESMLDAAENTEEIRELWNRGCQGVLTGRKENEVIYRYQSGSRQEKDTADKAPEKAAEEKPETDWKELYGEIVRNATSYVEFMDTSVSYVLADLSYDGTPELLVFDRIGAHQFYDMTYVFYIENGIVKQADLNGAKYMSLYPPEAFQNVNTKEFTWIVDLSRLAEYREGDTPVINGESSIEITYDAGLLNYNVLVQLKENTPIDAASYQKLFQVLETYQSLPDSTSEMVVNVYPGIGANEYTVTEAELEQWFGNYVFDITK